MDLPTYLRVKNEGLRRIIQQAFRVMGDGRMVGIDDVLRFEADQGRTSSGEGAMTGPGPTWTPA